MGNALDERVCPLWGSRSIGHRCEGEMVPARQRHDDVQTGTRKQPLAVTVLIRFSALIELPTEVISVIRNSQFNSERVKPCDRIFSLTRRGKFESW
jgi:hypothetical protein